MEREYRNKTQTIHMTARCWEIIYGLIDEGYCVNVSEAVRFCVLMAGKLFFNLPHDGNELLSALMGLRCPECGGHLQKHGKRMFKCQLCERWFVLKKTSKTKWAELEAEGADE